MTLWIFFPVIRLGPSRDATTGEVIWRHRALDADGICSPGIQELRNIFHNFTKSTAFEAKVSHNPRRRNCPFHKRGYI